MEGRTGVIHLMMSLDSLVINVGHVFMASTLITNTMERSPPKSSSRSGRQEFPPPLPNNLIMFCEANGLRNSSFMAFA